MIPLASRSVLAGVVVLLFGCSTMPAPQAQQAKPGQPGMPQTLAMLEGHTDVVGLVLDVDDSIGARVRKQDEYRILQVMNKESGHWKSVYKWTEADRVWPLRIDRNRGTVLLVSNVRRSRSALIELSLIDGKEHLLFPDAGGERGLKLTHEMRRP